MKKYFLIVSMLLSFLGGSATAQTIEESNALYKEFVRLANQGVTKLECMMLFTVAIQQIMLC